MGMVPPAPAPPLRLHTDLQDLVEAKHYKPKPKYFWWLALKDKPYTTIEPTIIYHMLQDILFPTTARLWLKENSTSDFMVFYDRDLHKYRVYIEDQDEAFLFKMSV